MLKISYLFVSMTRLLWCSWVRQVQESLPRHLLLCILLLPQFLSYQMSTLLPVLPVVCSVLLALALVARLRIGLPPVWKYLLRQIWYRFASSWILPKIFSFLLQYCSHLLASVATLFQLEPLDWKFCRLIIFFKGWCFGPGRWRGCVHR